MDSDDITETLQQKQQHLIDASGFNIHDNCQEIIQSSSEIENHFLRKVVTM